MPKWQIAHLVSVAVDLVGFRAVAVQAESVATTFGAGVSFACVVDVGAADVKISCVEDGYAFPASKWVSLALVMLALTRTDAFV